MNAAGRFDLEDSLISEWYNNRQFVNRLVNLYPTLYVKSHFVHQFCSVISIFLYFFKLFLFNSLLALMLEYFLFLFSNYRKTVTRVEQSTGHESFQGNVSGTLLCPIYIYIKVAYSSELSYPLASPLPPLSPP